MERATSGRRSGRGSLWTLPFLGVCLAAALPSADRVTGWRGDGTGLFPEVSPPLCWTGTAGSLVRWKTEVGEGMSSPVVVGDRVLVTAEPDVLLCVDRESGKVLWKQSIRFDDLPKEEGVKPEKPPATYCGYATPTPVTDGRRIGVVLGTGLVACYDFDGRRQWVRYLGGDGSPQYGRTASPTIVEGKLVVHITCLQALDLETGRSLWKAEGTKETYGSPVTARIGDVSVVLTGGGDLVRASDGKVLATQLGHSEYVTPVCQDRVVYFIDQEARAVELPETAADVIQVKELWKQELVGEFIASPVVHGRLIYTVNTSGTYFVLDSATGKGVEKELSLPEPEKSTRVPKFYPSLTLAGSLLFVGDDSGGSVWLKPGLAYAEAGRNLLAEGAAGTPAFSGGRLFLRGGAHLYCIGEK